MDRDSLQKRTTTFAHRCVKLAIALPESALGRHIRSQLIRCSTSVAANYRAVCLAQSKAEFAAKLSIVVEESDESSFWLEFLAEEQLLPSTQSNPLRQEAKELTAIFIASRKTVKNRSNEFPVEE